METLIMALIFFSLALFVRRREAFILRWQPTRHTWVAVGTGLLAFACSAALLLIPFGSFPGRLILFGLIYLLCGFAIPWGYTLLVERGSLADMGVRRENWRSSLAISLLLALLFSPIFLTQADLSALDWGQFARASIVLSGAGGLFELFLYYGFIHLRLEKAFGVIPAILATAAIYVLWHVGTQLPLEPEPLMGAFKLLCVGVMYQSVFSTKRNLLVIWPFFHWAGVMLDFAVNLGELGTVSRGFGWAVGTLMLMGLIGIGLYRRMPPSRRLELTLPALR